MTRRTKDNTYRDRIKPVLDRTLSLLLIVLLSPLLLLLCLAIVLDDPGPVLFTQKRVGKDKTFFQLHKFRSMKCKTPHDIPTHQLKNPEQYITRVGKFLRKYSLDELPQLFDIFAGKMSFVGPRPALWNQDDLVAERDRYGANRPLPGLTGWAQVNGRDELEIPVKAGLDGEYTAVLNKGGIKAFRMDAKCFFRTFRSVADAEGVVEGGTGAMRQGRRPSGTDRKRILILVNLDITLYLFRRELVDRLLEEGYELHLSCPDGEGIPLLREAGVIHHPVRIDRHGMNPLKDVQILRQYRALIRELKPQAVLGYTIKPNIYGALAAGGKTPFLANVTGLGTVLEGKGLKQTLVLLLYRFAFRKVRCVFFQNRENMRMFLEKGIVGNNARLLPGSGVNLRKFSLQEFPACGSGKEGEPVQFAFISRIMRDKGIEEYLKAAATLKIKYPQTAFHVCGFREKEYDGNLDAAVTEGTVTYHGMVEDVSGFLKDVHCIVLPSYHEGMSNVLLESAACGRALITSDIPGCREAVTEGVSGFLVPKKDGKALVKAMERFLALPYEEKREMGLCGRDKMEREFDRQLVTDAYLEEIGRSCGGKVVHAATGRVK